MRCSETTLARHKSRLSRLDRRIEAGASIIINRRLLFQNVDACYDQFSPLLQSVFSLSLIFPYSSIFIKHSNFFLEVHYLNICFAKLCLSLAVRCVVLFETTYTCIYSSGMLKLHSNKIPLGDRSFAVAGPRFECQ